MTSWNPAFRPKQEVHYRIGTWHKMPIKVEDWALSRSHDILDLHRMAEKFYDSRTGSKAKTKKISQSQKKLYEENLVMAAINDRLLKQAYADLSERTTTLAQKRKLRLLIERLEKLPHLYKPSPREESTSTHVSKWLLRHTDIPEAELVGFASPDPLEPRRFIATVEPRRSSSDTNVVLGKRKRSEMEEEDDYDVGAADCGSDTLLTDKQDCMRPLGVKRRRSSRLGKEN